MSLPFQLPDSAQLPLHVQLMLAFITGSGLLCLAIVGVGALRALWRRPQLATDGLPPTPPQFPYAGDQLFTALFIAFILSNAAAELLSREASLTTGELTWATVFLAIAVHIGMYAPMMVRYALLHPPHAPSRPLRHYLALPLLAWMVIYGAASLLEGLGFNAWLIETTHCPEYQDIVTLFTQGSIREKVFIGVSAVLVAPVAEECCFRGFLYTTLRRWGGIPAATLASALLFGAIHASLAQMAALTLFGIVQCIAYEKTRSLWLPIATHMLFNSVSLVISICVLTP